MNVEKYKLVMCKQAASRRQEADYGYDVEKRGALYVETYDSCLHDEDRG